jgi:hypothetical protein
VEIDRVDELFEWTLIGRGVTGSGISMNKGVKQLTWVNGGSAGCGGLKKGGRTRHRRCPLSRASGKPLMIGRHPWALSTHTLCSVNQPDS